MREINKGKFIQYKIKGEKMSLEKNISKMIQQHGITIPHFQESYNYAIDKFKQQYPVRSGFSKAFAICEVYRLMNEYEVLHNANE